MKISPMAAGGSPGTVLGNIEIGRTADASKLERAKTIARGETPTAPTQEVIPQVERPSTRTIKMRTNFSTNRDLDAANAAAESIDNVESKDVQSSTVPPNEQGAVEATQPLSPQLAALARQRRALQLERADFEKQKAELLAKPPEEGKFVPIDRLKSHPLSVLQENGVTYDQLTEAILSGQSDTNPELQALKQRLQELETGVDKKLSDRDQQAEQAALAEMRREAQQLASTGDDFELIRASGNVPTVINLIHRTYKETGEILDVQEAMRLIEEELVKDANKLVASKKISGQFQPQSQPGIPQKQLRTLTASGSSQAPLTSRQRALMAFQGTLKR